ncbi:MAG: type II toxin-antitoxin system Phd/YefM family antitoxin [Rhodoglobus sp.]
MPTRKSAKQLSDLVHERTILLMRTISASEARQTLPAQLDLVEAGEEVSITRHGRVIAVLVRPDLLAARRAPEAWKVADSVAARLVMAREHVLKSTPMSKARADELVDSVRRGRAER